MASKFTEKQLLAITIGTAVLITGVLGALIMNDRGEIEKIEGEITTLEAQIRACDVEIRKTPQREEDVLVFRAVEKREVAVLPSKQKIADFLRNLSQFFDRAGVRFQNAPESSPKESELAKGIYETRTNLSFGGDSASVLKFMNLVENDPRLIAIKGFSLNAGTRDRENPIAPIEHDVEMTLATYFYNPAAANVDRVHIPNEQRRLQEPKIRAAIQAFQPERPDTYVLRPAGSRRDPFVDPRERRVAEDPEAFLAQFNTEEAILVKLENGYLELSEGVEMENALRAEGNLFPADRKAQENDASLADLRARIQHSVELKTVTIPELQARLLKTRDDLERLAAGRTPRDVEVTESVAADMHAKLTSLFEEADYQAIASETAGWDSYVRGKSATEDAQPWLTRIESLRKDAKDMNDFDGLGLRVQGVMIDARNTRRSMARINGRSYRQGDKLEGGGGDIIVGRIGSGAVEILFRGKSMRIQTGKRRDGGDAAYQPRSDR